MLKVDKKSIIQIAIPIMLGTFIQNIVMITDAILVNKLGTVAFDAANNAGLLYLVFFMLNKGLGDGTQIQIANEFGKNKPFAINRTLNHSFVIQMTLSIVFIGILFLLIPLFTQNFVANKPIGEAMETFLNYRMYGLIFAGIQVSIMSFFIGIGKTKIIIYASLFLAVLNIFLDFGLIFGRFGLPEMGLAGAALASTISEAATCLLLFYYLIKSKHLKGFEFTWVKQFESSRFKQLIKLSYPLMIGGFLSIAVWFVFFSMIEQGSAFNLEVSHVVRNLFFISFIPIFGFGATTRTYVSYFHGKKNPIQIKKSIKQMLILSVVFYLLFFHGAILYPHLLVRLISDNPLVIEKSAEILQLVFGSMLIFSVVAILYNSVSALGKTFHAMLIEIVSILIYLIFSYQVILVYQWDIFYIWTVEYIYFLVTGILSVIYLWHYYKKMNRYYYE
ncbi:MATE family efflux transporter [Putridiphycobacter roseus]|nr:MATE family efflux transporter [Putridiphycobacter roseus]